MVYKFQEKKASEAFFLLKVCDAYFNQIFLFDSINLILIPKKYHSIKQINT